MGHIVRLNYRDEAPSGTWSILTPAGTAAVAFSDSDCTTVKTDRALNQYGRATFYLNATAVVTVANAAGTVIESFTEGSRAELTGVYSNFWTGTLPNGTQGLGGYNPLIDTLEDLATSFGSTNGYVKETGQTTPLLLKDALASVRTANFPYFNVKAAPYNAIGDGVANDVSAIQAAITAAGAAGGGVVYFPRGTYLCPTGLSITNRLVSLTGDGPGASLINYTAAAGYCLTFTGSGATSGGSLSNMGVKAATLGGLLVQISSNPGFVVTRCLLQTVDNAPAAVTSSTTSFFFNNVFDVIVTTATRAIIEITGNGLISVSNNVSLQTLPTCSFTRVTASSSAGVVTVVGNALTGSSIPLSVAATGGSYTSVGNAIGTANVFSINVEAGAEACNFSEAGHQNGIFVVSSAALTGRVTSASRQRSESLGTGTTYAMDNTVEESTFDATGTPVAVNGPVVLYNGAPLVLRIRNTTGAPAVLNYSAVFLGAGGLGNLAAGSTRVTVFRCRATGATPGWRIQSSLDTA